MTAPVVGVAVDAAGAGALLLANTGTAAQRALIALGSNLGDPPVQIARAVAALRGLRHLRVVAVAPCYGSDPWGPPGQPRYLNSAAVIETTLTPLELLRALLALERSLGKVPPAERFGPRSIDLDLLAYGQTVIDSAELTLPHPRLHERAFVLYPLNDIAPDDCIPGRGRVRDLAAAVDSAGTTREESGSCP
jgi:2-amino-4-hydroxy-6-hydroxymethyldihydropteridine diphosphokinase